VEDAANFIGLPMAGFPCTGWQHNGNLRDAIVPVAYIPFHELNAQGVAKPETQETFVVLTSGSNPLARSQSSSKMPAAPMPPPTHMVTMP